ASRCIDTAILKTLLRASSAILWGSEWAAVIASARPLTSARVGRRTRRNRTRTYVPNVRPDGLRRRRRGRDGADSARTRRLWRRRWPPADPPRPCAPPAP